MSAADQCYEALQELRRKDAEAAPWPTQHAKEVAEHLNVTPRPGVDPYARLFGVLAGHYRTTFILLMYAEATARGVTAEDIRDTKARLGIGSSDGMSLDEIERVRDALREVSHG